MLASGTPDGNDGNILGTDSTMGSTFGSITLSAGQLNLSPINDSTSPFYGMTFYQRRRNITAVTIQSNSGQDAIAGTLYARWAKCIFSGTGTYSAQLLFGSLSVTGANADDTASFNYGTVLGRANQVFLVE